MANSYTYNEMMVHIPLCTHKDPKNILIFSDDQGGIKAETARHSEMNFTIMAAHKVQEAISNAADEAFDVIIFDSAFSSDKAFLAHLNRVTSSDALITIKHGSILSQTQESRALFEALGEYFKIVMPYSFDSDETGEKKDTALLASKFYHPTADLILQRTDLLDGLSYYNCDIHPASFAQANNVRQALKGVARN